MVMLLFTLVLFLVGCDDSPRHTLYLGDWPEGCTMSAKRTEQKGVVEVYTSCTERELALACGENSSVMNKGLWCREAGL